MSIIADAIIWKYGPVVDLQGDQIIGWRHATLPQPTQGQIDAALSEYMVAKPALDQQQTDLQYYRDAVADMNVLLVRLIQRIMAAQPTLLAPSHFTVPVRQMYVDAKTRADRRDPGGAI